MPILMPLVVLTLSAAATAAAEPDLSRLQGLRDTRYHRLDSRIVDQTYHLYVGLPPDYSRDEEREYPTIYLLDGGTTYPLLRAYYRYLRLGGEVPEAILVGVSYGAVGWQDGNMRGRDYTAPSEEREFWGGAGAFQRILQEEVLPLVEGTYRARPDRRVIFGQSLGGQFVLYTALTRPDLFWGHVASNPALHRNLPFFLADPTPGPTPKEPPRLFVASGEHDDPRFREPALEWISHWTSRQANPWELETVTLPGETHSSAPPAAFRAGLAWLFGDDAALVSE